jgi:hypothetical protein
MDMHIVDRVIEFFAQIRSASAIAAAVESGRTPRLADLRRFGMDPQAFTSMGHG